MKENKGSNFIRDLLVKLLLIVIFVFLLMKLLPIPDLTVFKDSIFSNNINSMKDAAKSYYTTERMPSETGKSSKMTLQEMLDQNLLLPFTDKDGNACDTKKSYVKVTKGDTEYELKVSLTCNGETKYVIEKIGCYDFCPTGSCTLAEAKKEEVKAKTDNNGNITIVNDNGTYITEYEYIKKLTDESWKTGEWTVTKLDETDDIKLVDTKTEYTGQKKVDTNTTLYEEVSYGTNSYYVTDTNWSNEEKHDSENILVDTRTLYTGEKKVETGTKSYEYIKYGTRDNWTYDDDWSTETKTETDTVKLWQYRNLYTGQKEIVDEQVKYRYVKLGEKVEWTQTGFTTAERKETEDIKVLETRYTVTKEVNAPSTTCTNYQLDTNWYVSVPSDTSSRKYNANPVNSKVDIIDWELVDSSYASIGSTMPTYDGDYRYDYLSTETTACTKNCGGKTEVDVFYYRVYKKVTGTTYQYEYCVPQSTNTTVTDTRTVTDLQSYLDDGYELVKTEWNYNVRSTKQYVEDTMWTDHELSASEIPEGYRFVNKSTVKTTTYEDLGDWVTELAGLGEYTHNVQTKTEYKYKYNNPERYIIDIMWSTSEVAPDGYEKTGNEKTNTEVTYEPLKDWVESKEALGEYTYNIKTITQYKYKHLVTEKYIKDTKWVTEKISDEGYELTGNEKTTTNTTYISLGKWVDSKEALGDYTYNIQTRTLYKYKTRSTNTTTETIWATENPGNGFEPTGRSRTTFIPARRNVQK
jgi:hypothetical protein